MICSVCRKPKLLDVFSGHGGAGAGYWDAGFCPDPVDTNASALAAYPLFCAGQRQSKLDGVEMIYEAGKSYAAIHASPPCTGYSRGTVMLPDRLTRYDRLIAVTRAALITTGRPYVIENVEGAKSELNAPMTLCWTQFRDPGDVTDEDGTPLWMRRHRLFESSEWLWPYDECDHPSNMQCAGAYGGARRDPWEAKNIRHGGYVPSLPVMRSLLGTPWMSETGCFLSIPPTYTEWIGSQLLEQIG